MSLVPLLSADRIAILDYPGDRDAVLDTAAKLLAGGDAAIGHALSLQLRERERIAATAIGHGVAIPHARTSLLTHSCGAFLRLPEPIDFGAFDGEGVDLVLALAVPEQQIEHHLQLLAEVAEHFAAPGWRHTLRVAPGIDALRRCLLDIHYHRYAA